MLGQVGETNLDLKFALFRIPVRIHPTFWLVGVLFGLETLQAGPEFLMAWLLIFFVSILGHELGHALVAQYFGFQPQIVLYGMGGAAMYMPVGRYNRGQSLAITLAGPGAGFMLAGVSLAAGPYLLASLRPAVPDRTFQLLAFVQGTLVLVNIFWNTINLLPVLPLDGGQACRDVLTYFDRHRGMIRTYWTGVIVGGLAGAFFFSAGVMIAGMLFLLLAFQNYQALQMSRWR